MLPPASLLHTGTRAWRERVFQEIAKGKLWSELTEHMKNEVSPPQWKALVKEYWIQRGKPWDACQACTVVREQEYYEDLIAQYKAWMRLFPYHLSDYVCRILRITPFKYYTDMMATVLKDERSYDRVPNFTAADVLAVLGIGRNEYIAALNACKARRLLWRVNFNRDGIVREHLPQEQPATLRLEPWWRVATVNVGESEYRELEGEELAVLKTAALPATADSDIRVRDFAPAVLRSLLRRGLAYLEVPVLPNDRFAIPPLEGFVSNKTSDAADAAVDPLESLLYSVFVANSERMTVAELGAILGVPLQDLQAAIGVACRLGFATRVTEASHFTLSGRLPRGASHSSVSDASAALPAPFAADEGGGSDADLAVAVAAAAAEQDAAAAAANASLASAAGPSWQAEGGAGGRWGLGSQQAHYQMRGGGGGGGGAGPGPGPGGGVAVVVDTEATGYLMMGALSPGLKRHAVTLFEGGRVAGEEVMRELLQELWASCAASQSFEGDMVRLTNYAAALACLLEAVRASAGPGLPLELLRKESLAGLQPAAVYRVLTHAYCAIVPISPLPPPVLPLSPDAPGPAYYGPTREAASPWLHLALYSAARCGPHSFVFVCGQRVWRLPHPLDRCSHALLTPWDDDAPEQARHLRGHAGGEGQTTLVESSFLLHTLNDLLTRTAVLVQPLEVHHTAACPDLVDVPLPLPPPPPAPFAPVAGAPVAGLQQQDPQAGLPRPAGGKAPGGVGSDSEAALSRLVVQGVRRRTGEAVEVVLERPLVAALRRLGVAACVGYLRLLRMRADAAGDKRHSQHGAHPQHPQHPHQQLQHPHTTQQPPPPPRPMPQRPSSYDGSQRLLHIGLTRPEAPRPADPPPQQQQPQQSQPQQQPQQPQRPGAQPAGPDAAGGGAPASAAGGLSRSLTVNAPAVASRSPGGSGGDSLLRHSQSYSYGHGRAASPGRPAVGSVGPGTALGLGLGSGSGSGSILASLAPGGQQQLGRGAPPLALQNQIQNPNQGQSLSQPLQYRPGRASDTGTLSTQSASGGGAGATSILDGVVDAGLAAAAAAANGGPGDAYHRGGGLGGSGGGAEHDSSNPWLPLSVQLGVPLHSLELCRAVCRAATEAGFLTAEGRAAQLQASQNLHSHLHKLMSSYTHTASASDGADGSPPSAAGAGAGAAGGSGGASLDGTVGLGGAGGAAASSWGWVGGDTAAAAVVSPGSSGSSVLASSSGGGGGGGRLFGSLLPLPAVNLSFDGHSLQPIRLRDSVQGLGCVCQG